MIPQRTRAMRPIYLLVERTRWQAWGETPYTTESLATQGFVHCSFAGQVVRSANKFHAQTQELLAIEIDPARLRSPMKEEQAGNGDLFPHVYGPIDREAVVSIEPLQRGPDGCWLFTPSSDA